jgi:hypothetical protein
VLPRAATTPPYHAATCLSCVTNADPGGDLVAPRSPYKLQGASLPRRGRERESLPHQQLPAERTRREPPRSRPPPANRASDKCRPRTCGKRGKLSRRMKDADDDPRPGVLRWLISCDESGVHGSRHYGFGTLRMAWQR